MTSISVYYSSDCGSYMMKTTILPGGAFTFPLQNFYSESPTIFIQETDTNGEYEIINPAAIPEKYKMRIKVPEVQNYPSAIKFEFLCEDHKFKPLTEKFVFGTNDIERLLDILSDSVVFYDLLETKLSCMML